MFALQTRQRCRANRNRRHDAPFIHAMSTSRRPRGWPQNPVSRRVRPPHNTRRAALDTTIKTASTSVTCSAEASRGDDLMWTYFAGIRPSRWRESYRWPPSGRSSLSSGPSGLSSRLRRNRAIASSARTIAVAGRTRIAVRRQDPERFRRATRGRTCWAQPQVVPGLGGFGPEEPPLPGHDFRPAVQRRYRLIVCVRVHA